jgi:cholesterol oxidase
LERDPDDKEKNPPRLRLDKENSIREVIATQTLLVMSGEISILPVPTLRLLARLSLGFRTVLTWFLDRGFHELIRILITDRIAALKSRLQTGHFFADKSKTDEPAVNWGSYITSFLKFAKHASESRVMQYRLTLRDDNTQQPADETEETTPPFATYHLRGTKQIGYAASWGAIFWKMYLPRSYMERTNVWQSLGQMQVQIDDDCCNPVAQGTLNLDLLDMSRMHAPQLGMQRDTPNALLALVGYPLWFMRLLVKTRIWDFRLPDYPDKLPIEFDRKQGPIPDAKSDVETPWPDFPPLRVYRGADIELTHVVAEKSEDLIVDRSANDTSKITLRLTRYKQPKIKTQTLNRAPTQAKVLLMLNGFAQSTLGFVPQEHKRWPSVNGKTLNGEIDEPGLAEFFYEQDFDIWLFDYRTSSILDASKLPCSMDDIAQFDIPGAVDHVLNQVRKELRLTPQTQLQIYAFAHCVGAASLAISLLDGRLAYPKTNENDDEEPIIGKLAGVTFSQMQAYLVGSMTAQLRLQAGGLLRDTLGIDYLRLSAAERQPTPMESLLDRLFASLPVDEGEHCPHENKRYWPRPGICTCKRMTGSISRLLKHDMIKEETHDRLPIYFGRANTSLLVHGGRCVENERLVNADGQNVYVTDANIKKYLRLPIAILHGHHNALFNVESAHRTFQQFARVNFDLISKASPADQAYDLIIAKDYAHFDCTIGYGKPMQEQILKPLKRFYDKAWALGGHLPESSTHMLPRPGEECSEGKAPLAGPIMGWSRSLTPAKRLIRFWIEVDESESDLAKFAVTVVKRMTSGFPTESAQLWPIVRVPLEFVAGRDPKDLANWNPVSKKARVAIALADLEFPEDAAASDYQVQMFSVHDFWFNTPASGSGNTGPVHAVVAPPNKQNSGAQTPPPAPTPIRLIGRPITPEELEASNQAGQTPGRGTVPARAPGEFARLATAVSGSVPLTLIRPSGVSLGDHLPHFKSLAPALPASYIERIEPIGPLDKSDALVLLNTLALREAMPVEEAQRGKPATLSRDKRHLRPNQSMPYTARIPAALLWPKSELRGLRFLATCCRHPGLSFEDIRADASFERMEQLLQSDPQNHRDCLLLLGDQIYADASYGLIDNPSPIEKITIRNRKAFSARGFNSISTQVPTYMVFDDHEIVDLWCLEDRMSNKMKLRRDARKLYAVAVASFAAYQWSHGPRNSHAPGFNYSFEKAGFSFFALDTRTQRRRFSKPPTVCTADQLDELKQWLGNFNGGDTAPKFIMTGSLVVPGLINESLPGHIPNPMAESWQMAPEQRADLLRTIAQKDVKNVVFLSGDIHCDATAELTFKDDLKAYSIITPPLYAPLPGANSKPTDVLMHEVIDLGGGNSVSVKAQARDGNGFADIHVTPLPGNQWRLSVHFYRLKLEHKEPEFRMEVREFLLS